MKGEAIFLDGSTGTRTNAQLTSYNDE